MKTLLQHCTVPALGWLALSLGACLSEDINNPSPLTTPNDRQLSFSVPLTAQEAELAGNSGADDLTLFADLYIDKDSRQLMGVVRGAVGEPAAAVHIHAGIAGSNSPPVIRFEDADGDGVWVIAPGEEVVMDAGTLEDFTRGAFYVDAHHTNGGEEVRAQLLGQRAGLYLARLHDPATTEPFPLVKALAILTLDEQTGNLSLVVRPDTTRLAMDTIQAAHIHRGEQALVSLSRSPTRDMLLSPAGAALENAPLAALRDGELSVKLHSASAVIAAGELNLLRKGAP